MAPASAPPEVRAIIEAGNEIATKPYKYGGGHARINDSGYDCSGSVSYVLHAAGLLDTPLDSTGFMSWGEPGRGAWVTVRTNPSHAYLIVAGLRFDTSARRETGNRWSATMRSASGYTGRHPDGALQSSTSRASGTLVGRWRTTRSQTSHRRYVTGSRARSSAHARAGAGLAGDRER